MSDKNYEELLRENEELRGVIKAQTLLLKDVAKDAHLAKNIFKDRSILDFFINVQNYCKVTNCDVCQFQTSRGCQWRNLFDYALGSTPRNWNLYFASEIMNEEKKESENG